MGLLRKHIRDDAGRRVPVYRTGWYPWRVGREIAVGTKAWGELHARRPGLFPWWFESGVEFLVASGFFFLIIGISQPWDTPVPSEVWGWFEWAIIGLVGLIPIIAARGLVRSFRARAGHRAQKRAYIDAMLERGLCASCGYECGLAETCPECAATWKRGA